MLACGEFLIAGSSAVPSPWFKRLGDAATFFCDVIAIRDAVMAIAIRTKDDEDADSSATTLATVEVTGTGVDSARVASLKELVRFEYTVSNLGNVPPSANFVHFRMLPPAWENNTTGGSASPYLDNDVTTKEAS